jgi:hypothetical protein
MKEIEKTQEEDARNMDRRISFIVFNKHRNCTNEEDEERAQVKEKPSRIAYSSFTFWFLLP